MHVLYIDIVLFDKKNYGEGGVKPYFWHNRGGVKHFLAVLKGGGQTYFGHFFETPQCVDHIIAARPLTFGYFQVCLLKFFSQAGIR